MARKIISYYNDAVPAETEEGSRLIIEISNDEIKCMVKNTVSGQAEGFEMFLLDKGSSDWSDTFYAVRANSQILNKAYRDTHCYYNFEEAVIIPAEKFSATAAEDYLSLLYGESHWHDIKFDTVAGEQMVNAYRVRKSINDLVGRHFVLYKPHHVYSAILEDVLTRAQQGEHFVKAQFYSSHIIATVVKDKQLQLIQSFRYQSSNDILYYLSNIVRQFSLDNSTSHLELSGVFESGSSLHEQLKESFGKLSFDVMEREGVFRSSINYAAHYFTPFYKLDT